MAINLNNLLDKVDQYKNKGENKFAKTTFLPEGKHKGKLIVDPRGELFCQYYSLGYFNKGIRDPRSLPSSDFPEGFVDELTPIVDELSEYHFKWRPKFNFLVWFFLEDTDSPDKDNWQPGNLYCVIGNNRLRQAVFDFVEEFGREAPDEITRILDPEKESPQLSLNVTRGTQGSVTLSFVFPQRNSKPIDTSSNVWCSLEDGYIRPGFNEEKYNALLEQYSTELEKYISSGASKQTERSTKDEKPEIPAQDSKDDEHEEEDEKTSQSEESSSGVSDSMKDRFARFRTKS